MGSTMLLSLQHCRRIIVLHVSDINWQISVIFLGFFSRICLFWKHVQKKQINGNRIIQYLKCIRFNTKSLHGQRISVSTENNFVQNDILAICNLICHNITVKKKGMNGRPGIGGGFTKSTVFAAVCVAASELQKSFQTKCLCLDTGIDAANKHQLQE